MGCVNSTEAKEVHVSNGDTPVVDIASVKRESPDTEPEIKPSITFTSTSPDIVSYSSDTDTGKII